MYGLFVLMGSFLGFGGCLLGLLGAWCGKMLVSSTHLFDLPPDIYGLSALPMVFAGREVFLITVIALMLSIVASFYPAWVLLHRHTVREVLI